MRRRFYASPAQGYLLILTQSAVTTTFNIYATEKIVTSDGTVIYAAGTLVDTIEFSDTKQGKSRNLPLGVYSVREVGVDISYHAEIVFENQATPITRTTVNINEDADKQPGNPGIIEQGQIQITMNHRLAGAVFAIRTTGGEVIATLTTDNLGRATSQLINHGTYEIHQITAPSGYLLDRTVRVVELTDSIQNIEIINQPNRLTISAFETGTTNRLSDVDITIWQEPDTTNRTTFTTNHNGQIVIERLAPGTWFVQIGNSGNSQNSNDEIVTFYVGTDGRINGAESFTLTVDTAIEAETTIPARARAILPQTGVQTNNLIVVIGIFLIIGGVVLVKTMKKDKSVIEAK